MVIPLMACEYDAISKARSLVKRGRERERMTKTCRKVRLATCVRLTIKTTFKESHRSNL